MRTCIHTPTTWSNVCMYVIIAPNEVQIEKLSRELDSLAWQLVTTAHTYSTYIHTQTVYNATLDNVVSIRMSLLGKRIYNDLKLTA